MIRTLSHRRFPSMLLISIRSDPSRLVCSTSAATLSRERGHSTAEFSSAGEISITVVARVKSIARRFSSTTATRSADFSVAVDGHLELRD